MEQRVNIQYSVTIGELEREIARLLELATREIKEIDVDLSTVAPIFSASMLDEVSRARSSMMRADIRLDEVSKLINGYLAHVTSDPKTPEPSLQPPQIDNPEDLQGLKEKLTSFKEQLADLETVNEVPDNL